jgi:hypothetical protein
VPKVFQSKEDSVDRTEIVGVGVLWPGGEGPGVTLESAAETMSELQDENGDPLKGTALTDAAKEFAEARNLRVVDQSEKKLDEARASLGLSEPTPAVEAAEADYQRTYGGLESRNTDGEVIAGISDDTSDAQPAPQTALAADQEGSD